MKQLRTAEPYRNLDVIDANAPRFNQAVIGSLALVAFLTGWWPLLAILAAQLAIGLTLGRRWCLPCVAYFELVQPRIGEGEIEDARPPRFANLIGATVLSAATLTSAFGLPGLGRALGGLVAALALLAAVTGLCAGCELYRLSARLRGVKPGQVATFDLASLTAGTADGPAEGPVVVEFTHPLCGRCQTLGRELRARGAGVAPIAVSKPPERPRRYHVSLVPAAFSVAPDGRV